MNKVLESQILVIFGASGDLTRRKLIPALLELFERQLLPDRFLTVGVARTQLTTQEFRESLYDSIAEKESNCWEEFLPHLHYVACDMDDTNSYLTLFQEIEKLRNKYHIADNTIFYLATPPLMYSIIPTHIQAHGLHRPPHGWRRIIIEKPYGKNEQEVQQLDRMLNEIFLEREIYRIDHFLGKETVQNILVLRFANSIWEPLWNRNYIDHVEIYATETLGVELRGDYYESTGALCDMVQSHLLQLMAFIAMEPPTTFDTEAIRDEIAKVFRSLAPILPDEIGQKALRGQYTEGKLDEEYLSAYRNEPKVDPQSTTETFVALKLYINNWRWADVPFYIYTGKRLNEKRSEVIIHFRHTPQAIFPEQCSKASCNQLVINIHPNESIRLQFGLKQPATNFKVKQVSMDFSYESLPHDKLPDAYERLLLDAMQGEALLYSRSDSLELSWRFLTPLIEHWEKLGDEGLLFYPAGSSIPQEVTSLLDETLCLSAKS